MSSGAHEGVVEIPAFLHVGKALPSSARSNVECEAAARLLLFRTALEHDVSAPEILGKRKNNAICKARKALICALDDAIPEWSHSQIARFVNRDRTTVCYTLGLR
jgi:chromosomal replication initiation ATPase DnaA